MTCCPVPGELPDAGGDPPDPAAWTRDAGNGTSHLDLLVPGIHCASCISRIERTLAAVPGVVRARVNMSSRRVALDWRTGEADAHDLVRRVARLGYRVQPFDAAAVGATEDDATGQELLRALAVAGFAAANIMLLSVSVWSGAEDATRDLFHWLSALIALPTVVYSGRPFYRSALAALKGGGLNMDVPISLGVTLAAAMSLYETVHQGRHAYFDAAVMLLFFLLIGRFLDHRLRARARSAVSELMALNASGAWVIDADDGRSFLPLASVRPGMRVAVAPGDRVPVDGTVLSGRSDLDRSLVTGETVPEPVAQGSVVHAGALNMTGPIEIAVTASGGETFLAEMIRLMDEAERGRARYVAIADRVTAFYAPAVHLLAGATFLGWLWATGSWHMAVLNAVTVLIITCPCALALAVPVVHVVASGVLFRAGVLVKDGAALERLAEVDTAVFDKTGTLTRGRPEPVDATLADTHALAVAAGLARESRHPLSRALAAAAAARGVMPAAVDEVRELPGCGVEGRYRGVPVRLGRRDWCGGGADDGEAGDEMPGLLELWLDAAGRPPVRFAFRDRLRGDAAATLGRLRQAGLRLELLSGDRIGAVAAVAAALGIADRAGEARPQDKLARLDRLAGAGRRVLMVGDGINDAPALAAAHVSMSPGTAADVSRSAASLVFVNDRLSSVADALDLARRATRLVRQNFALALVYNLFAVPIAVAGLATPLVAAIVMSSSSLIVTGNALRLRLGAGRIAPEPGPAQAVDGPAAAGAGLRDAA